MSSNRKSTDTGQSKKSRKPQSPAAKDSADKSDGGGGKSEVSARPSEAELSAKISKKASASGLISKVASKDAVVTFSDSKASTNIGSGPHGTGKIDWKAKVKKAVSKGPRPPQPIDSASITPSTISKNVSFKGLKARRILPAMSVPKEEDGNKRPSKTRVNRKHDPIRQLMTDETLEPGERMALKKNRKLRKNFRKLQKGVRKKSPKIFPGVPHAKPRKRSKKFSPRKSHVAPLKSTEEPTSSDPKSSLPSSTRTSRDDSEKGSDVILEHQEAKCPDKPLTHNTALIRSLLRSKEKHRIPEYVGGERGCPRGLEFLTDVENLTVELRNIDGRAGVCFSTFSQYDIIDNDETFGTNLLVALGIESTSFIKTWCFLTSRSFHIQLFDYNANFILGIKRKTTCGTFCTSYFCCCCCCESNGCGNGVEVTDCEGSVLGYVKQCSICATRLVLLSEMEASVINTKYHGCAAFCTDPAVRNSIPIRKFDVYNAKEPTPIVRIEQYVRNSNICKFIYYETLEQVGFVRKLGDNKMQIDLWKDFDESEKAVLIAACFLIDHLILELSTEGSYLAEKDLEGGRRKVRGCLYRSCCYLRCRLFTHIFLVLLAVGLVVCILVVALGLQFRT